METMSKKDAIKNAVSVAAAHGFALPGSLEKMVKDLDNPQYRVAVVGKYQVGKSTLINKVFLGERPLLTEGRGLCTTAVATDMEYGPGSAMEVYDWTDETHAAETCVKKVDNPTIDDVNAATVSSDMSTRSQLAKRVSRVRITAPNDALRGYAVIDTPGLDDPEAELLANTTFRIIPQSDVALLVVGARMLDEVEQNFLRNELFGNCGISRLLVLVSYNAKVQDMDADQRNKIVRTIKAELDAIGRGDIDVMMYCFDNSINDIMSDIAEIRTTIRTFLNANALPGREEKVASLLKRELETVQVQIAAKLKASNASAAEIAAARERLEKEVAKFKRDSQLAFDGLNNDFSDIRDQMYQDVDLAVEGAFTEFYSQVESAPDFGAKTKKIAKAEFLLKSALQSKISVLSINLKERICSAVEAYSKEIAKVHVAWNLYLSDEFGVDRPFLAKIPPFVLEIINVIILDIMLPGGPILAAIARVLAGRFGNPTTWLVDKLVMPQLKKALDESQCEVRQQIMDQIADNLQKTYRGIKAEIDSANQAQVDAIRGGIDEGSAAGASADRVALESAKADIAKAIAAL